MHNSSIQALENSIQKWEKIQSLINSGNREGAKAVLENVRCALCRECSGQCEYCVVQKWTGEESCNATPYYTIHGIFEGNCQLVRDQERKQDRGKSIEELVSEMIKLLTDCRSLVI